MAEQARIKRRNEGESAFLISAGDRIDAENALRVLRKHGVTLKQAADFAIRHLSTIVNAKPIGEVVEELLVRLEQDGASGDHLNAVRSTWRRFAADHPRLNTTDFDALMVDRWLRGLRGISGGTRNDDARRLSSLFIYAVKFRYAVENPLKAVERVKIKPGMPKVLTIPQVIDLLRAADPVFMPCLLLGVFAGLRPLSEVCRLTWERINFETKEIYIAPGCTKNTKSVRYVGISDNLLEWLLPYRQPAGPIVASRKVYQRAMKRACVKAGFGAQAAEAATADKEEESRYREWTKDVLRHTYCSMYLAKHRNMAAAIDQMGHTGSTMIFKHYRSVVTARDAEVFWSLRPVSLASKVVRPGLLLPELAGEYLATLTSGQTGNLQTIRSVCTRFAAAYPLLRACEVQAGHVEDWLAELPLSEGSRHAYSVRLSGLFRCALAHGYVLGNPAVRLRGGPFLDVAKPSGTNIVPMTAAA